MKKICAVLFIGIIITGCRAPSARLFVTPIPDPGSDAATLYKKHCSGCHSLPHPARHTYPQWEHMLDVMETRMEERGVTPPEEEERRVLLDYLKVHASGGGR